MGTPVIEATAVAVRENQQIVRPEDFMPLLSIQQATDRKKQLNQFISGVMTEGEDYGSIPGGQKKKVLLKPGAEKMCSIFGMAQRYLAGTVIEDWTGKDHGGEPLFHYEYKCQLYRGDRFMGEAIGSCNSWEMKYRYRWVSEEAAKGRHDFDTLQHKGGKRTLFEPGFALDKRETTGTYGKPVEHWDMFEAAIAAHTARSVQKTTKAGNPMPGWEIDIDATLYRVPNPDVADAVNTCQKMAQKRALVAVVLVVTNCSDAFTQDLEDFSEGGEHEPARQAETTAAPAATTKSRTAVQMPNVPPELKQYFAEIDKGGKAASKAVSDMYQMLMAMFDERGGSAIYETMGDDFQRAFPQGTSDMTNHKRQILALWDAVNKLKEPAE